MRPASEAGRACTSRPEHQSLGRPEKRAAAWAAGTMGFAALPPRGQGGLDQRPPGIGQGAWIRSAGRHTDPWQPELGSYFEFPGVGGSSCTSEASSRAAQST